MGPLDVAGGGGVGEYWNRVGATWTIDGPALSAGMLTVRSNVCQSLTSVSRMVVSVGPSDYDKQQRDSQASRL